MIADQLVMLRKEQRMSVHKRHSIVRLSLSTLFLLSTILFGSSYEIFDMPLNSKKESYNCIGQDSDHRVSPPHSILHITVESETFDLTVDCLSHFFLMTL